jgi:hypothetical protein
MSDTVIDATVNLSQFMQSATNQVNLGKQQRLLLVEQALLLLEQCYVHRPLKEAMHAVRPVQRLRLLQHRLEHTTDDGLEADLRFHNEMTDIFVSVRDLHTNYLLPTPFANHTAYLPFLVEEYYENGQRRYIASKVTQEVTDPAFQPGVEILYWSGIPIERAVELSGERQAGSNFDARHVRGLDALTIRPLLISLPPDAHWEVIRYIGLNGQERELRQEWKVLSVGIFALDMDAVSATSAENSPQAVLAMDLQAEAVREMKQLLFAPKVQAKKDALAARTAFGVSGNSSGTPSSVAEAAMGLDLQADVVRQTKQVLFAPGITKQPGIKIPDQSELATRHGPADGDGLESSMPKVLNARVVTTSSGTFGYIRIYTFSIPNGNIDGFLQEFIRLVRQLPQNGLIIDVRGNGGGYIWAGERLLQLLTSANIQPEPVMFITSPLILRICTEGNFQVVGNLSQWVESLRQAVTTGATYSASFPLTPEEWCNNIGQIYVGPVVLITDARCYSTTDIFSAGFQDHRIGTILGVDGNTGAGGANVWTHDLLQAAVPGVFKPLPNGAGMRVAIRATLRVGPKSGTLLEDLGVKPDVEYRMTKNDLLNSNQDLINHAGKILKGKPSYELELKQKSSSNNGVMVTARTRNLDRLDFFIDDRPKESRDVTDGEIEFVVTASTSGSTNLLLRGYKQGTYVASQRLLL